jgi:hypothetical protein
MTKGNYYIVTTLYAGTWFGLYNCSNEESDCLTSARRIFDVAATSLSTTQIAATGVSSYNKIMKENGTVWLKSVTTTLCAQAGIDSIQAKAEYTPTLNEATADIDTTTAKTLLKQLRY